MTEETSLSSSSPGGIWETGELFIRQRDQNSYVKNDRGTELREKKRQSGQKKG